MNGTKHSWGSGYGDFVKLFQWSRTGLQQQRHSSDNRVAADHFSRPEDCLAPPTTHLIGARVMSSRSHWLYLVSVKFGVSKLGWFTFLKRRRLPRQRCPVPRCKERLNVGCFFPPLLHIIIFSRMIAPFTI